MGYFFLTGSGFSGPSHRCLLFNVPALRIKTKGGERDTHKKTMH